MLTDTSTDGPTETDRNSGIVALLLPAGLVLLLLLVIGLAIAAYLYVRYRSERERQESAE
jgi:hypothetical protein